MTVTAHFRALSRRWEGREERPQGRPSAAARPAKGAPRARGTPPTLPQPTPPSLAASARVRRPLRPARAVRRPPRLAGAALGGGAATSLRPASTRQTGRDASQASQARGLGSEAAAAAAAGGANGRACIHKHVPERKNRRRHAPPRVAAVGGGEVVVGGADGGDGARDAGRRGGAGDTHRAVCEREANVK